MNCKYTYIGILNNLLPWLFKCRTACTEYDCVPFCTQKLLMNIHFCMTTTVFEGRVVLHSSQVWGWGSTTHLASITSERGVPPLYFCETAFLQGLLKFKIRRRIVGFSLLFYSCSCSHILWSEPWTYRKSRGFPRKNCSKITLGISGQIWCCAHAFNFKDSKEINYSTFSVFEFYVLHFLLIAVIVYLYKVSPFPNAHQ